MGLSTAVVVDGGGGGESTSTITLIAGPGTGVSPFVGFLQHLHALKQQQQQHQQQQQQPGGLPFLFFGCRNSRDFLFQSQLETWKSNGVLADLWVAYSRPSDTECSDAGVGAAAADLAALALEGGGGCEGKKGQYVQDVILLQRQVPLFL